MFSWSLKLHAQTHFNTPSVLPFIHWVGHFVMSVFPVLSQSRGDKSCHFSCSCPSSNNDKIQTEATNKHAHTQSFASETNVMSTYCTRRPINLTMKHLFVRQLSGQLKPPGPFPCTMPEEVSPQTQNYVMQLLSISRMMPPVCFWSNRWIHWCCMAPLVILICIENSLILPVLKWGLRMKSPTMEE